MIWLLSPLLLAGEAVPTSYLLSYRAGTFLRDGKVDVYLTSPLPPMGAAFSMEWAPSWESLVRLNRATVGLTVDYQNLSNNRWLGSMIGSYAYLRIPLFSSPHFVLSLRPGVGLALSTHTYWNTRPEGEPLPYLPHSPEDVQVNQCIGSYLNVYFNEGLLFEFPLRDGWSLGLAATWQHYSNGSSFQPNSGYNMLGGELFARKDISSSSSTSPSSSSSTSPSQFSFSSTFSSSWDFELSLGGGFRQVYYRDRQTFGVASLSLEAYYRPWYFFRIGAGVDVFYDGAYRPHETTYGKTFVSLATPADCWRLGISVHPEFVVGRFSAGFAVGAYLLDGVKNLEYRTPEERALLQSGERLHRPVFYAYSLLDAGSAGHPDGWLYTRLILKYRLTPHLFLHAGLKGHLMKAEFIDAGLGLRL